MGHIIDELSTTTTSHTSLSITQPTLPDNMLNTLSNPHTKVKTTLKQTTKNLPKTKPQTTLTKQSTPYTQTTTKKEQNIDSHNTTPQKELKAVRCAIESFLPVVKGRRLLLHEDNQTVVGVLTHLTSRSPTMM